ncbi:hypothetical protein Rhopal_007404-T1 [Rhodotorula paludigena]|uniref:Uncharacterized protein n=1 Tax=Rhodotorula paludigena TaxID=86838 RepID=A0AAV5GWJ4_9BASI|nr:hypothetical protein Rhopal_007404-T1 [Rhodotorula paludigena]
MPPAHGRLKENRREDEYTSVMASIESHVQPAQRSGFGQWRSMLDELLLNVPSERDPAVTDPPARAKLCVWSLLPRNEQDELYTPLHQLAQQLAHQREWVNMEQLSKKRLDSEIKKRYNSGAKCRRNNKAAERAARTEASEDREDKDAPGEPDWEWLAAHGHNTFHALGKSLVALSLRQQVHYGQTHAGGRARRAF